MYCMYGLYQRKFIYEVPNLCIYSKGNNEMNITLDEYTRDPQTGADRRLQYPSDWTPEVQANAIKFLAIVGNFLDELGIDEITISSGFRPLAINNKTLHAAKSSYHMSGLAIDIRDNEKQDLGHLIASRPDLLRKYNLFLEDLNHTHYWAHIDLGTRADRPSRIFIP
jgi:hypothetical protein